MLYPWGSSEDLKLAKQELRRFFELFDSLRQESTEPNHEFPCDCPEAARYTLSLADRSSFRTIVFRTIVRSVCERLLNTDDANTKDTVVWTASLAPESVSDFEPFVRLADEVYRELPETFVKHTLGVAMYRAGKFERAMKVLESLNSDPEDAERVGARLWCFMAMTTSTQPLQSGDRV